MQVVTFPNGNKIDGKRPSHLINKQEDNHTACGLRVASSITRWSITHVGFFETRHLGDPLYTDESKDNLTVVEVVKVHVTCGNCLRGYV